MRLSKLFTKTLRDAPKDEVSQNAQLLIRAGFIHKEMAGVYSFLPLGLRVLKKIESIIREEMNKIGAHEVLLPALQPKENWEITGRWESMDDLYKIKAGDEGGQELALGPTHEEIIVPLARHLVASYKDLPFSAYQFQTKFRNEKRAKSGLLRGREFLMKDMYSFHADEMDLKDYYEVVRQAYYKIFERAGIGEKTYFTFALGGTFSKYSHEFQTLTPAGEDTIYICEECRIAVNKEAMEGESKCIRCGKKNLQEEKAIEVGNIFELKTRFSEPFDLRYIDNKGEKKLVQMGCFGIGLGRLMGAIVEVHSDRHGLVWPPEVAPFRFHLIRLSEGEHSGKVITFADVLYKSMNEKAVEVLYDDRDEISAGEKFADADLIGVPFRLVVSSKTVTESNVELKERRTGKMEILSAEALIESIGTSSAR